MREQLQALSEQFANQEVFIVAGGYSIKELNLDYLHDKPTIAINESYSILPNATALYWCDNSWCAKRFDGIKEHKSELRFTSHHNAVKHVDLDIRGLGNSTFLHKTTDFGFDPNPNNVAGNNSGVQALNLVVNMKPKRIYLLGYDMRDNPLKRGETHWHQRHELAVRNDIYSRLFVPSMEALYREMKRQHIDIEIINCSKTSALNCFKKDIIPELVKND